MSNIILGDLGGYMAHRARDNQEFRLDTPEPELEATTSKSSTPSVLTGLGHRVARFAQHLFKAHSKKTMVEGKVQP